MYMFNKHLCHLGQYLENYEHVCYKLVFPYLMSTMNNHSLIQPDLFYQHQLEPHPQDLFLLVSDRLTADSQL